jgi:hypothetical protein
MVMWIVSGPGVFALFAKTMRHLPTMSGAGEIPGELWLDHGPMAAVMMSLPTLLLAAVGIGIAAWNQEPRDIPCFATLATTGGTTLFLVGHTEARYLLPAVPFLIYFALRSVEAFWRFAQARWPAWNGLRRAAVIAGGALLLAAALRVGVHQAVLEEDPLYRADLERRAAEKMLAARGPEGRLFWYGSWATLHTRWAGLVLPHDEFFGIFHFPEFAIPYFIDRELDPAPARWPRNPDKLALFLKGGDAVLRNSNSYRDAMSGPSYEPPMEVWSAHSLRFRAESDLEFAAVGDTGLRIRLQPDGQGGAISASPLDGRWQVLVRSAPDAARRLAGTVTLTPGVPGELPLRAPGPVREIELFQLQATRIE